ncbi:MAG: DUF3341 domain-containing protein [Candidatus Omnitrophica bacterium]|nr:MAG: Cytochrome c [Candidatus Hinthialibacteria bacterium OLB16]MCK6496882.1 DUF3341 domain-containing protein [bacterium]MCL4734572.1 DUF3341 domain-containing protein [Candidatus Omnitrophota bacterium]
MSRPQAPGKSLPAAETKVFGVLAEYDSTHALLAASEKIRDAGYKKWDTHTPFPVHGIDEAMGIRRTILPLIVLICGLTGCASGLLLQWWTSSVDYPVIISGKPMFSIPAYIPVTFELTILFSAFGAVFGMLGLNRLPLFYHGVFNSRGFSKRMTTDRFFISIEAIDPKFDASKICEMLRGNGAIEVEVVEEPAQAFLPPTLRRWGISALVVLGVLALIPPALIARSRSRTSENTRLQLMWDMDQQPKFKAQSVNPLFADGRAMRPQVPGTVARGEAFADDHLNKGLVHGQFAKTNALPVTETLARRGQHLFGIYCSQCHGLDGYGHGPVAVRAERLQEGSWVAPLSMHDQVVKDREDGHIFNTITNGIRTMPAYGDQITIRDRWAIVAYIRALERSQDARIEDVPADRRGELP